MINEEQRQEQLKKLDENMKNLYLSPDSGEVMLASYKKFIPDTSQYIKYAILIGDTILGFHQTIDLPRLFQKELGMGADDSQHLLSELSDFLKPVIEREEQSVKAKKEDLDRLAKTFAETKGGPREIQPDGKPEDVKPLRTMEGDMSRVHGYGAYRAQETPENNPATIPTKPVVSSPTPATSPTTDQSSGFTPASVAAKEANTPTDDEPVYRAEDQAEILKRQAEPRPAAGVPPKPTIATPQTVAGYSNQAAPTPPSPTTNSDSAPNNVPLQKPNNPPTDDLNQIPLRKIG